MNTINHFNNLKSFVFFSILCIASFVMIWMIKPFFYPLFLGIVLTILFRPFYKWLTKKLPNYRKTSAIITLITIFFVILVPIASIVPIVTEQTIQISTNLSKQVSQYVGNEKQFIHKLKQLPFLENVKIDEQQIKDKFLELTNIVSTMVFNSLKELVKNTFSLTISVFIMFYSVYYFLVDGNKIINKLMRISPLDDAYESKFIINFVSTTKAVLKSTLLVGCIQGLVLGSSLFWLSGVTAPLFWGVLMTIFAVIPILGTGLIWAPVALFQILTGNLLSGIVLIIGGAIIANVDNVIKPILIQKDINIHPLIILLSTFGGLSLFGLLGFIIGPIIASLVVELWNIYEFKYKTQLNNNR